MKKLSIVLLLLFSCSARLAAQKSSDYIKDFHLDEDIYCFNISHTGKLNYNPLNEPEINEKGGLLFCPGRFDWIMPSDETHAEFLKGLELCRWFWVVLCQPQDFWKWDMGGCLTIKGPQKATSLLPFNMAWALALGSDNFI